MTEQIISASQIELGDILMKCNPHYSATMVVTCKWDENSVEGVGYKDGNKFRQLRFFFPIDDIIRIGHVELDRLVKHWIETC